MQQRSSGIFFKDFAIPEALIPVDRSRFRYTVADLMKLPALALRLPLVLALGLLPRLAFACSCMAAATPEENNRAWMDRAQMVFMGSVSETTKNETQNIVTINVEKAWKGRPEAFTQVATPLNSALCGYEFTEGKSYIIFAQTDAEGTVTTTLCSGTAESKSAEAASLIAWLNAYVPGSSSSSVSAGSSASSSPEANVCTPYQCANGDVHPSCTEDGHTINYFVNPCQFSGGEANAVSSSSSVSAIFMDVDLSHPNAKAIRFVKNAGVVEGYPDGSFKPGNLINRAEFTKIIISATFPKNDIDTCETGSSFSDVHADDWFGHVVCKAQEANVIGGYPDGTFRPGNNVNFAEAAKIVVNAFAVPITSDDQTVWWRPFVFSLAHIGGLPASFSDPNQLLTRADMAEIIERVMRGMGK